jgi:hypothetical protein
MGHIDLSRSLFDEKKRYASIRCQQGRVILDDDINEAEHIDDEDQRLTRLDVIGPSGTPDDGFGVANGSGSGTALDFDILPGTIYVGGLRLTNPDTVRYDQQPDWLNQPASERAAPATGQTRRDLVYLEVWQQSVTAVEDSELLEAALAGPDTSARVRTMWRVRLARGVTETACMPAWEALTGSWAAAGLGTALPSGERAVDAELAIDFVEGSPGDLCTPSVASGYLGAENQAIRVQIIDPTHFTWGFDNGSQLYRVRIDADRTTVNFLTEPKDQAHWPRANQVVEVLPWSAVLSPYPDVLPGEKVAELTGHLSRVQAAFDPVLKRITLTTPIPAGPPVFGQDWKDRDDDTDLGPPASEHEYYFLRVWDRGEDLRSDPAITFTPGSTTPVPLGTTGLGALFSGSQFVPGDHWIVAARPETPELVVPWKLQVGRSPNGVRRFYAPLAIVDWQNTSGTISMKVVSDCRRPFPPLTRLGTCCTYTVGDDRHSFGMFSSIQEALNRLPNEGGKICVLPGKYEENLLLDGKQKVVIEGCGRRSQIVRKNATVPTIELRASHDIELRSLAVAADESIAILARDSATEGRGRHQLHHLVFQDLEITARDLSAISVEDAHHVEIRDCDVWLKVLAQEIADKSEIGRHAAVLVRADDVLIEGNTINAVPTDRFTRTPFGGLQIGGGSERVEIRRNKISGGSGNAITLGEVAYVEARLLGDEAVPYLILVEKWMRWPAGGGFHIVDAGCLEIDPFPPPPKNPQGEDLVPVATGSLLEIDILENELTGMGAAGIAVARFFDKAHLQFITVDRLLIRGNRIRECIQCGVSAIPAALRDVAAVGAIALADGELITIRENEIERNGTSHVDPICGVFALHAELITVESNTIVDNAPRSEDDTPAKPGFRGGIVLPDARTPANQPGAPRVEPPRVNGLPAARILDNVVEVPEGRALLLFGVGTMLVSRNHFTTRGVATASTDYDRVLLAMSSANLEGAARIGASKEEAAKADSEKMGGVLIKVNTEYQSVYGSGLGLMGLFETPLFYYDDLASPIYETLDYLGGVTVLIQNRGISGELGGNWSGWRTGGMALYQAKAVPIEEKMAPEIFAAGKAVADGVVQFSDNHASLVLRDRRTPVILSSVAIQTLDDAGVDDNVLECETNRAFLYYNLHARGASLRVTSNRLRETLAGRYSGSVIAKGMCSVTSNQSTRCIFAYSLAGTNLFAYLGNLTLLGGGMDACARPRKVIEDALDKYKNHLVLMEG